MASLTGKRVALLVATGSEQSELVVMRQVLAEAGAEPVILSPKKHDLRLWLNADWGERLAIDLAIVDAKAQDFRGLVMPGGVVAADILRADRQVVQLVKDFLAGGRPVGAMGHAVWVLIEAEAVKGRIVTSIESIRSDVYNAGGNWVDDPAVLDRGVATGRHHHDLPDFMAAVAEELARD